jgi:hypothetical protein
MTFGAFPEPPSPPSKGRPMPIKHVSWTCETCHKRHFSYEEANRCELDHIVNKAVADTQVDIAAVFEPFRSSEPAKERTTDAG